MGVHLYTKYAWYSGEIPQGIWGTKSYIDEREIFTILETVKLHIAAMGTLWIDYANILKNTTTIFWYYK